MKRRQKNEQDGIDISPLIDMVFILLIFFMVSTTFVKDAKVDINRPTASTATAASEKSLRVTLDSQGQVTIDGKEVRSWMLQSRVRDFLKSATSKEVLIVTDKSILADQLIHVVDQCRLGGAQQIAVATIKEVGL
ncbi:MAG: biopolymer transporter ExbD [Myxococcales bacterium]|nr:biopolymer transporter ExbD [Myxococcales bacterium]|tara:strand:+ start:631 stop:1035 length:405 start_codon:yes stop_codon:yes gene_type:complete